MCSVCSGQKFLLVLLAATTRTRYYHHLVSIERELVVPIDVMDSRILPLQWLSRLNIKQRSVLFLPNLWIQVAAKSYLELVYIEGFGAKEKLAGAPKFLDYWYGRIMHSRIELMKKVARISLSPSSLVNDFRIFFYTEIQLRPFIFALYSATSAALINDSR